MLKRWFNSLFAFSAICLLATSVRAQTVNEVVLQTIRQLQRQAVDQPRWNLVCQEKETVTSFKNNVMTSSRLYEAIVVNARLQDGRIDQRSSYRELLSVDGKRLPTTRQVFNIPLEMGVTHAESVFGAGYPLLQFTLSDSSPGEPQGWIVAFQKKELATDPPGYRVPNFGQVWIDKPSHRILRAEMHDEVPVTKFLNGPDTFADVKRSIVEDFNLVLIDGAPHWLVKTRMTRLVPKSDSTLIYTSAVEYLDCRKFGTTITIKPLP